MDASNGLNVITRKAHKRCDASVEQVSKDLEFVESVSEHDTNRTTDVDEDAPDIKVGDVCPNDQRVVMGVDDTILFFLAKSNGGPAIPRGLRHAPMLSAEDLMCVGRPVIMLDEVVGCAGQSCSTADGGCHVDLAMVRVWERWKVVEVLV